MSSTLKLWATLVVIVVTLFCLETFITLKVLLASLSTPLRTTSVPEIKFEALSVLMVRAPAPSCFKDVTLNLFTEPRPLTVNLPASLEA